MNDESVFTRRSLLATASSALGMVGLLNRLHADDGGPVISCGNAPPVVHIYPDLLTSKDKLTPGPGAMPFSIQSPTLLVWVDLMPNARFGHDTLFVLISAAGARIEKANWWPIVNDFDLFRDGKVATIDSPIVLA